MATFTIILDDSTVVSVTDADAYGQEGPLTTFFRTRNGTPVIDSWSERLASFRTASMLRVQRLDEVGTRPPEVVQAA